MEKITNNNQSVSVAGMHPGNGAVAEEQIRKHEIYLHTIGTGLGLCGTQSASFVEQVLSLAARQYAYRKDGLQLRTWLAKMMVHKCLYHISSELFSQTGKSRKEETLYSSYMPLSFWAVYKLHHTIGLNEIEIAHVLNTSVLQVKERLNKAQAYRLKQRNLN